MNTFCVLRPGIHPWAVGHVQPAEARTPTARELLQRQIDATDRQIDRLVYESPGIESPV